MIAATEERSIVVHPDMVTTLGKGKRATDLRGRWNSSVEMYTWALENLYASGKLAQGTIAYYHPYWLDHHLRDHLIAAKVFVFYISVADGVAGTALMHEVMAKTSHGTPTKAVSVIGFIGGLAPRQLGERPARAAIVRLGRCSRPAVKRHGAAHWRRQRWR